MSAEIFISYARADRDRVLPLVERLREAGVTYWLDEGNIQGATLWGKEIVEAIRNAKVLVLFATEASFESKMSPKRSLSPLNGKNRFSPCIWSEYRCRTRSTTSSPASNTGAFRRSGGRGVQRHARCPPHHRRGYK